MWNNFKQLNYNLKNIHTIRNYFNKIARMRNLQSRVVDMAKKT